LQADPMLATKTSLLGTLAVTPPVANKLAAQTYV